MKTRRGSLHRFFRTLSHISYIFGAGLLIASLALNAFPAQPAQAQQGGSGSIWTTIQPCSVAAGADQDKNQYDRGQTVVVRGEGFIPSTGYVVTVTGQPGGASGDPKKVVASTPTTTDATGYFCVDAYTVQDDDWGTYTVDLWLGAASIKNDNYRVDGPTPAPTNTPTNTATNTPTDTPTATPTDTPTVTPTDEPTATPTDTPTVTPTDEPTATPTDEPTGTPTDTPTVTPTDEVTATPTDEPTATPTNTEIVITDVPTSTPETPEGTPTNDPGTPTPPPTLPPPAPTNPPQVLIPVTGADMSMPAPIGSLQTVFGNTGLALLGVGMVLQGLSRKFRDE